MAITVTDIGKSYGRRSIISSVSFHVSTGEAVAITGRNGSGKSTLLKIIAGLLSPTRGRIAYDMAGTPVRHEDLMHHIGFMAPYLNLYDEFSAEENIAFFAHVRGLALTHAERLALLRRVGLPDNRRDPIRAFSSGMKQRLKLAFAIMHRPAFLLLDEPATNLDRDGIDMMHETIHGCRAHSAIVIATNDAEDIARCDASCPIPTA